MKIRISIFLIILLTGFSCRKTDKISSSEKRMVKFEFQQDRNAAYLSETIKGIIEDSVIEMYIPDSVDISHLKADFSYRGRAVYVHSQKQESGKNSHDFTKDIFYVVEAKNGSKKRYRIEIKSKITLKNVLPHIYIDVDNNGKITSRSNYVHADIRIDGKDKYPDYQGRTKIRGRGNSTWGKPKKPYKLKLIDAASLLGLPAYKKWILLANYNDGSLLLNSVPYTTGRLLGIPYTNHIIPVELTLNGEDKGFYIFTEHKEVGPNRIDIGKGDNNGVLLELDSYFDETTGLDQFKSPIDTMPVMIKYPKLRKWDNSQKAKDRFNEIKADYNAFEALVYDDDFPNNDYLKKFDALSFVNYMIVYQLTCNQEFNVPHSTYINQLKGGKYRMSIIWDFDWGFGYSIKFKNHDVKQTHYNMETARRTLFWKDKPRPGNRFFSKFMKDPRIKKLFKERWKSFKNNKYPLLIQFIKHYAEIVRPAYDNDHAIWGVRDASGDIDTDLKNLLDWLNARVNYIDDYAAGL